jgi:hypothetical protein
VRVVLIKPGVVATSMAQRTCQVNSALYPHAARIAGFFAAPLSGGPAQPGQWRS